MSISTILTYIYLFFGLIIAAYVLLASYNIYTKGYRATSAFFGIVVVIVLFGISFGSAITAIHNLGTSIDKIVPSTSPSNQVNPTVTPKGKFY